MTGTLLAGFPRLETANLILRQMRAADAEAVFRIFADDEVTRFYDLPTFTDVDQARQLIERQEERFERGEAIRWGITRKEAGAVLGTCGLFLTRYQFRGELGYDLSRAWWGRGIMTEALGAILQFGFDTLELNRIQALVMPGNVASLKLLRRLGFQTEGVLRQYGFSKGRFHDLECWSLLRGERRHQPAQASTPHAGEEPNHEDRQTSAAGKRIRDLVDRAGCVCV